MLQIKHVCKQYQTGKLIQKALDDVSLNLRDSEFVAVLGPSGSGKTTLLNIIGGLDRYDSGDLIINGISTKKYKDRDWDSYRNHTIGFVFQSYNLIPHQTLLSNVELALTISGVGKAERRRRARAALESVGLGDQVNKRPGQLSGGQMQRVAIARALVNDPDILLADEPTGALDSDTSVQVMDLLREVARDRLVVMVTHNPELAEQYATRIVKLRDGQIRSDSNPYEVEALPTDAPPVHKNMGKSSMSFLTALSLSLNNLGTKKARTILTSFAGSIGIIGIALILSISNGVNTYIDQLEQDTLSEYPLEITDSSFDMTSMMMSMMGVGGGGSQDDDGDVHVQQIITNMLSEMDSNDLKSLKEYFDSGESGIEQYVRYIEYTYDVTPRLYIQYDDGSVRQVNPDISLSAAGLGSTVSTSSLMSSMMSTDMFYELPGDPDLYENQYEVMAGRWPESYDECVLVLTSDGSFSDFMLYTMGLRDGAELDDMVQQFLDNENVDTPDDIGSYSYDELLDVTFKLVSVSDFYEYDDQYGIWRDKSDNDEYVENLVANGEDISIVGIVQPASGSSTAILSNGLWYLPSLTEHVANLAAESEIVQEQLANPDINVFTGTEFGVDEDDMDFDMSTLFTIDEDALSDAFTFDFSDLDEGMDFDIDLSDSMDADSMDIDIDLSDFADMDDVDLSGLGDIDYSLLFDGITFSASEEQIDALVQGLTVGYQWYAEEHPEADYSNLSEQFQAYLQTEDGKSMLSNLMQSMLQGSSLLSEESVSDLMNSLMTGFYSWIYGDGSVYADSSDLTGAFSAYISSDTAREIVSSWLTNQISGIDISSSDVLQQAADTLISGYVSYAQANGYADPSKMGDNFAAYLSTDWARQVIEASVEDMVNEEWLEWRLETMFEPFVDSMSESYSAVMTTAMEQVMDQISDAISDAMQEMVGQLEDNLADAMSFDFDDLSETLSDAFSSNMDEDELMELLMSLSTAATSSYEGNLSTLGYADFDSPTEIDIYSLDFESKEQVVQLLDDYNSRMEAEGMEEKVITYTDMVGSMMSSVTDIVNIVSYVLIAFVAISLIVSSIMIGVITYISVLERRKEIGILRAIGASKRNISEVFDAETIIIGFCAGLLGVIVTLLLLFPVNAIIAKFSGDVTIIAVLPFMHAVVLILISICLTFIGGFIPSSKASKSDPVAALRTD